MTGAVAARQGLRVAVLTLVLVLLAGASYQRNRVWHTLLSLWEDAASKSPLKSRVHNNLGNCYVLVGKHFKAIEAYERAVALDRNNVEAYYNLGVNFENVGILNRAVYYYDRFCKTAPSTYREQQEQACKRVSELTRSVR
jgi:tetratricopeptide (TPR) repeat protein